MSRMLTLISLAGIVAIVGSGCGGGASMLPPPPPPPPKSAVPTPTVLRTLYRVVVNGTDRMTTIGPNERSSYRLEGQVYYVPDQSANGRSTLNREVNSSGSDHADATASLNGYSQDLILGFPWSSASVPGVTQLTEAFNSSTGDYALVPLSESLPGYNAEPLTADGYPRYGNASEVLLSLSAGGVTVQSNAVAGGTTWRWFWNGVQFVNHGDYGREIQGAFYYGTSLLNPNEAGDLMTFSFLDQSLKHGSPILRFEDQGTTQITRAIPLNWDPSQFGGDQDHPVIWDSLVLGKDLTLNFQNLGSVAKYTTHLVIPAATRGTLADPAGYLLSSFNRYWTYDARSKTPQEVTSAMPDAALSTPTRPSAAMHFSWTSAASSCRMFPERTLWESMASALRRVDRFPTSLCGSSSVGEMDLLRRRRTLLHGVQCMGTERMCCSPPARVLIAFTWSLTRCGTWPQGWMTYFNWACDSFLRSQCPVSVCHNDLIAANLRRSAETRLSINLCPLVAMRSGLVLPEATQAIHSTNRLLVQRQFFDNDPYYAAVCFAIFVIGSGMHASRATRPRLGSVHKNQVIPHHDWLANDFKLQPVHLHLVPWCETQSL